MPDHSGQVFLDHIKRRQLKLFKRKTFSVSTLEVSTPLKCKLHIYSLKSKHLYLARMLAVACARLLYKLESNKMFLKILYDTDFSLLQINPTGEASWYLHVSMFTLKSKFHALI